MGELITQCLDLVPEKRPGWKEINMRQLEKKAVLIEEFEDRQPMRYDLGTKSDKKSRVTSSQKKRKEIEELIIEEEYEKKSLE